MITRTLISLIIFSLLFSVPGGFSSSGQDNVTKGDLPLLWTHWGKMDINSLKDEIPLNIEDDTSYWIVQFGGPITPDMRKRITERGMKIVDYFPDFAYIVNTFEFDPEKLDDIRGVVGAAPFPAGLKISPQYYNQILNNKMGNQMIVELFEPITGIEEAIGSRSILIDRVSGTRFVVIPIEEDPLSILYLDGVKWVEPKSGMVLLNDVAEGIMDVDFAKSNLTMDGTGQIVAISDSGLDTGVDNHSVDGDIHLDFDNRVTFSNWAGSSPDDYNGHGTHVAGSVAGDGTRSNGNIQGMATNASIFFQGIETDSGYLRTPNNISLLFSESYQNGARIHTNSWGSSNPSYWGVYTTTSYDVDWSMYNQKDMLILFAAGNDGRDRSPIDGKIDPDSVSPPATSKSTLTVGATENYRPSSGLNSIWYYFGTSDFSQNPIRNDRISDDSKGLAAFSSRGPTDDGRIKPEIVAPGINILSTKSSLSGGGWASYDQYYYYLGGTSMATPLTAGTAVLVRQYFNETHSVEDPSGALIKSTLINGAVDLTPGQYGSSNPTTQEVNSRPDNDQGFGRVNFKESVEPEGKRIDFLDHWDGITTDENVTRVFHVDGDEELRLTLAWSDYPGPLYSGKQLINDLDLVLTAPNGTVYKGNDLTEPRNDTPDRTNVVESITVSDPSVGWWRVEVEGYNIPMGKQPFALVMSGNATNLINDTISMDRGFYSTSGDIITITLTSRTIAGVGTVNVFINSTSEPEGKNILLKESEDEGTFIGQVMTVNFSESGPDEIFVSHLDNITVRYYNSMMCGECVYKARAADPAIVTLEPKPENWLIYSKWDRIILDGVGDPGLQSWWTIENSSMGWIELHDDGTGGDENASDGLYHSEYMVETDMRASGHIHLKISDPYLGERTYQQFPLAINTSKPQAPGMPKVSPLPMGNSLILRWSRVTFQEIDNYTIYVNRTPTVLLPDMENWEFLSSVNGRRNYTNLYDLIDGITYHFRVSAVNTDGNESSASLWGSGIPSDILSPEAMLQGGPRVLTGEERFDFKSDPDTEKVFIQYYNDSNENGEADDGNSFVNASSGGPDTVVWNTTTAAGGPGDMQNMIIRFRAVDEVPNFSPWTEVAGFGIDNTGPSGIVVDPELPGLTRRATQTLSGVTEPNSYVKVRLNGLMVDEFDLGSIGSFERVIRLEEGNNTVELIAFDEHGAGPTIETLYSTLDTMKPEVTVEFNSSSMEIGVGNMTILSTAEDRGLDPDYTKIDNITWNLYTPSGDEFTWYGKESLRYQPSETGEHSVKVTVRDMAGNSNYTERTFSVVDSTKPIVNISGVFIVDEDTKVTYTPQGSTDNDVKFLEREETLFLWNITHQGGWNRISRLSLFEVLLLDPGIYTLRLSITDPFGNTGTASREISVRDNTPPEGAIEGERYLYAGDTAEYSANITDNDPIFPLNTSYGWTVLIVNNTREIPVYNSSGDRMNYTFEKPGIYRIRLIVEDGGGNRGTFLFEVDVDPLPSTPPEDGGGQWLILVIIVTVGGLLILAGLILVLRFGIGREEITEVEWEDEEDVEWE